MHRRKKSEKKKERRRQKNINRKSEREIGRKENNFKKHNIEKTVL